MTETEKVFNAQGKVAQACFETEMYPDLHEQVNPDKCDICGHTFPCKCRVEQPVALPDLPGPDPDAEECGTCGCTKPCLCQFERAVREIIEPRSKLENATLVFTVFTVAWAYILVGVGAVAGWGWLLGAWGN